MKKLYQLAFNAFTRIMSYGVAVALFSILWSGLAVELNLLYLVPIISLYFDFSSNWFSVLQVLFVLPFPTAMVLYGAFTRLGIPALLPSFRLANKYIYVGEGVLKIQDGLAGGEYRGLLKAVNRLPAIFFIVAVIEVAYIDIIVLAYAIYNNYSIGTLGIIGFSWFAQTSLYAGCGFVLSEWVTAPMRKECKKIMRSKSIEYEVATRSTVKYKMLIFTFLMLSIVVYAILMTYLRRGYFLQVLTHLAIFGSLLGVMAYYILRVFYRALHDVEDVLHNLKERGEGIMYAATLDREIVEVARGVNSASDTITDYRRNLEYKVEERTKELSQANEEIEAAMEEMEAINDDLTRVNRDLEDSNCRFKRDMEMAASVQAALLPKEPPRSAEYDIALAFKPMSGVSGDFYDFYTKNSEVMGLGIFDVSGHGISSGLLTLLARSIIERNFKTHADEKLGTVMGKISTSLISEIGQSGFYITGILLRFKNGNVEYANSAHPHMLYRTARSGKAGRVAPTADESIVGPFLGIETLDGKYGMLTVRFTPGDALLAYTDSLAETVNGLGAPFEEEGILKALKRAPDGSAREMLDYVMNEFYKFAGKTSGFSDDITAILIKKK